MISALLSISSKDTEFLGQTGQSVMSPTMLTQSLSGARQSYHV